MYSKWMLNIGSNTHVMEHGLIYEKYSTLDRALFILFFEMVHFTLFLLNSKLIDKIEETAKIITNYGRGHTFIE